MITEKSIRGPIYRDYIFINCINYDGDMDKFMMIMDGVLMSLPCVDCYRHFQGHLQESIHDRFESNHEALMRAFGIRNKIKAQQGKSLVTLKEFDAELKEKNLELI